MADIKSNEREFMSQVTSWLNEFLRAGAYPFTDVSSEASVKTGETTKFPDVQIWINRAAHQGFCELALKTPATSVDDHELLEDAAKNARAMHADYFVTWNMRDAVIWRTPQKTETVSKIHRLKTYSSIHRVSSPDDLWVGFKQELLKARAKEILNDLSTLYREGHLHLIDVDSVFFVHKLSESAKALGPHMHDALISEIGKNPKFKNSLFDWAVKQGIARHEEGETFFDTVSRQIVYRLLGKILFYLTLMRFRSDIQKLDLHGIEPKKAGEKLKEAFEIARQIDYQAVFEEDFTDTVPFPVSAVEPLTNLLDDLNRYNFSHMPQDVVGNVFEKLIPPEERHGLGQYFTNENLVDLITAFCVRSKSDKVLDPTCGTGTFLIRAYDRLRHAGEKDHKRLLFQLWGVDVAHFPAELATINLYRQNIEDYANFPRVIAKDFFEVKPGDTFKFPPPKPTGSADFTIDEKITEFDAVVGNFPYIRQELIEKRLAGYKDKLTKVLAEDWKADYRELFNNGDLRLSGQADIYAYLFFHAAKHLKDGGRMGIVTSNAWLDVAYGYELQKFFLKNFKIVAILESRCEPWFEEASVNTIVTILERCKDKEQRDNNNVKFVKIKQRLKELIPWDMKLPMERWLGIDRLIHTIENAGREYYKLKGIKFINTLPGHATHEDESFRIRVLRQGGLLEKVEEAGKTVKWGQYLRAPDIYFEILEKCKDKLVPLRSVADVRFGIKPGITNFFFLEEDEIKHWKIEDKFLARIIRTPKEAFGIVITQKDLKHRMLVCRNDIKTLIKHRGIYSYIKWGEKQVTENGTPWPEVPSVQGRKYWYDLGERKLADGFWPEMYYDSYRVILNGAKVYETDKFYGITSKTKRNAKLLIAVLNSSILNIQRELTGFHSLGEGVLKAAVYEVEDILTPYLKEIDSDTRGKILKAFDKLLTRPIKPIFEEVKMKDRQAIDSAVLEALGLDPKKYLKPLYEGLTGMVRERIDLAKSRKKIKNAKTQGNIDKLREQVIEEILPEGPKKFPDEFIDSRYLKDAREIPVPNEPLKLGSYFMGKQEVTAEGGFHYEAESPEEAKFIVYSQRPDSYILKIPENKIAVLKAIDEYERYLKDLKAKLFETFFGRTLDHRQADALVSQVFDEMGLPEG